MVTWGTDINTAHSCMWTMDSDMALSSGLGRKTSWPWAMATQVRLFLVTTRLANTKVSGRSSTLGFCVTFGGNMD